MLSAGFRVQGLGVCLMPHGLSRVWGVARCKRTRAESDYEHL